MIPKCCLAGIDTAQVPVLTTVLSTAGLSNLAIVAKVNVTEIARIAPTVLVCDVDSLVVDKLEQLRQLRFVLPQTTIALYTQRLEESWAAACHLAGANCMLAKTSSCADLASGIRAALRSGCFTDPHFATAGKADPQGAISR